MFTHLQRILNVQIEKVDQETKSYLGGDEELEKIQKIRGFNNYKELYSKKLLDYEKEQKSLRDYNSILKVDS